MKKTLDRRTREGKEMARFISKCGNEHLIPTPENTIMNLKKNKNIEPESVEHLVTILSCWLESNKDTESYKKCIDYVNEWVEYRSQFVRDLVSIKNN
jgi:hypothetical protein